MKCTNSQGLEDFACNTTSRYSLYNRPTSFSTQRSLFMFSLSVAMTLRMTDMHEKCERKIIQESNFFKWRYPLYILYCSDVISEIFTVFVFLCNSIWDLLSFFRCVYGFFLIWIKKIKERNIYAASWPFRLFNVWALKLYNDFQNE